MSTSRSLSETQKDLGIICIVTRVYNHHLLRRWWKDRDFTGNLPFVRDRIVECYMWILSVYFEPQFSFARIFLAKIIAMISLMDDMFDAYGTLEELELFTEVLERCEHSIQ